MKDRKARNRGVTNGLNKEDPGIQKSLAVKLHRSIAEN